MKTTAIKMFGGGRAPPNGESQDVTNQTSTLIFVSFVAFCNMFTLAHEPAAQSRSGAL